jgi:hypothetical protein
MALKRLIDTEHEFVTKSAEAVTNAVMEELSRHNETVQSGAVVHVSDIKMGWSSMSVEYRFEEAWQEQGFQAEQLLGRSTGGEDGVASIVLGCHIKLVEMLCKCGVCSLLALRISSSIRSAHEMFIQVATLENEVCISSQASTVYVASSVRTETCSLNCSRHQSSVSQRVMVLP